MSNIAKAFEHGKAFIPFITCGYPDLETTEKIVYAMVDAGADLIELGIPFQTRRQKARLFRRQISVRWPVRIR